ncbi:hypothetical protein KQX54_020508 [Cotesia glomerata]|uniref:Uncharacterized protein n=1 Tax=Cotesia glomerata TaxID=32391 RepID=A0AAV7IFY5_COTGL|nr:hypothetical protein KQX54_020508 [Cotesia glomerata]
MSKILLFLFIFGMVTIDLINACIELHGATGTYCCDNKHFGPLIFCTNTWGPGTCEFHYTNNNPFGSCATAQP